MLENLSEKELITLASKAEKINETCVESLIRKELEKRLGEVSLISGVYDASEDMYNISEHPEDEQWIIRGEN